MISDLESTLAFQLTTQGILFDQQVKIPGCRYIWDFRVNSYLIEVNGGIWHKGGHNTGAGLIRDYKKANVAALAGYHTLFFTADDVNSGEALRVIEEAIK